ncbi:carbonic anhydrase 7-like [Saccoglossus kowalevskii]|uniref:Carbonic anhydrase n=1 Tax=Saccoglossus kowalevskii TaxID=10224 RepID=A0ABM0GRP5_SACKO|nr:PREDICTED: carbonic anhydrase 14-like [Saccoglossus kowalevskii]
MMFSLTLVSFLVLQAYAREHAWSYKGNTGPEHWSMNYKHCAGERQSPINIDTTKVIKKDLGPLTWIGMKGKLIDESRPSAMQILNNGHTVQVNLKGDYYASGGGLPSGYKATQLHFHWGEDKKRGSEHQLNGKQYPGEVHLVAYDFIRFNSLEEALQNPTGVAVFATFIDIGKKNNDGYNAIIDGMDEVEFNGEVYDYQKTFPIHPLMSNKRNVFYRYEGSLTTPPCYESVLWTVFKEPVRISQRQMQFFREMLLNRPDEYITDPSQNDTLLLEELEKMNETIQVEKRSADNDTYVPEPEVDDGEDGKEMILRQLINNFRPVQKLNGRSVTASEPSAMGLSTSDETSSEDSGTYLAPSMVISFMMLLSSIILS